MPRPINEAPLLQRRAEVFYAVWYDAAERRTRRRSLRTDDTGVARSRFAGLSIWQFCDCRASEMVSRILGRPRGYNNKGVVDEYRRPKLAYEVVKGHYTRLQSQG